MYVSLKNYKFSILYIILFTMPFLTSCSDMQENNAQNTAFSTDGEVMIQGEEQDCAIEELPEPEIINEQTSVSKYIIKADDVLWGSKDAKVVLIEYFSPTCPHCVYFHNKILPVLKEKYIDTNKIAYIFREFISNKQDLDATILAKCSGELDSYTNFMNVLLAQQSKWAFSKNYREILTNIGMLGGVNAEKFGQCLQDEKMINSLMENTKLIASEPNFVGTPAFIINGEFHLKSYSVEDLSNAIDKLLKE